MGVDQEKLVDKACLLLFENGVKDQPSRDALLKHFRPAFTNQ